MAEQRTPVPQVEREKVFRNLLTWANTFPDLPQSVTIIAYEQLKADATAMALSKIQSAWYLKRYILGGYSAESQFAAVYRIKPGTSNDARLKADELLIRFGEWSLKSVPELGDGIRAIKVEPTSDSVLIVPYENGDEDHQILMRLIYEVI